MGPAYWLTKAAGWLSQVEHPVIKNLLISQFIKFYQVDMSVAQRQHPEDFRNFEDFFTRELLPEVRSTSSVSSQIVSPVDGRVAVCGVYSHNTLVQFKHTTTNLLNLTGSRRMAESGQYVIIYLSPKDYHRIHAPIDANLFAFSKLGGSRHSVNPRNHRIIQGLYEKNVRVNSFWRVPEGEFFLSMVGALIVSSIRTPWDELMPTGGNFSEHYIEPIQFLKGQEIGQFTLGSTVILVIPEGLGELIAFEPGHELKLGEPIGRIFR